MADAGTMATKNGVQPTVSLNCQTEWHNVFPSDQPVAFTTAISPWIHLADGLARQNWNIVPTIFGGGVTTVIAGVVEGSTDNSFPFQMGTFTTTAGDVTRAFPFTITTKRFRIRITSITPNGAIWFRVGAVATGS